PRRESEEHRCEQNESFENSPHPNFADFSLRSCQSRHLEIEPKYGLNLAISGLRTDCRKTCRVYDLAETGIQRVGCSRRRQAQLRRVRNRMIEHVAGVDAQLHSL